MKQLSFLSACVALCALVSSAPIAAAADDGPTVMQDYVNVRAFTIDSYQKNFDVWSWLPEVTFRVNGPIPSGSQLYCEFTLPTGPWVKFDCKTEAIQKDHWWGVENAGGRDIGEDKGTTYIGPVDFAIKLRNELAGTDAVLYKGKLKVAKAHSNESGGEKFAQRRPGAVVMMGEHVAANTSDFQKAQLAGQEAAHGRFIGGIEHRSTRPAAPGNFVS